MKVRAFDHHLVFPWLSMPVQLVCLSRLDTYVFVSVCCPFQTSDFGSSSALIYEEKTATFKNMVRKIVNKGDLL